MRRTTVLLVLLAAGAMTLSGCGSDDGGAAGGAQATAAPPASSASAAPSAGSSAPAGAATTPTANVVGTVTLVGGKPQGGVQRISTKAGAPAVLVVTSDTATEIHVHGADRTVEVPANTPTDVDVSQSAPGSYEVEDHGSDALLVQLRVG